MTRRQRADRPNIVLFLTDDHARWALGCYGNPHNISPTLDHIAQEGWLFANAFTPSPVCSPARSALLTGKAPSQVGIHDWLQEEIPEIGDRDWLPSSAPTLPALLKNTGYVCALSGKWHLGRSHITPDGFDWYFGIPGQQGGHSGRQCYVRNGSPVIETGIKTDVITDHALAFLESNDSEPFYLQVGYIGTHSPWTGHEPDLVRQFAAESSTQEVLPSHPWALNEWAAEHPTPASLRDISANYYAAVAEIDRGVARIMKSLHDRGFAENTLIVYTSDHGLALGHHGFFGKGNATRPVNFHDISIRVPLLIRGPNIQPSSQRLEQFVDHYDVFQFICNSAGIHNCTPQIGYPGIPFGRSNHEHETKREIVLEYGDSRAIRTHDWKLILHYPEGPNELYNLRVDPDEIDNRFGDSQTHSIVHDLNNRLDAFYRTYVVAEHNGLLVRYLPRHNLTDEPWRDGERERRGFQRWA